jgi:flagellar assembly protein FliH
MKWYKPKRDVILISAGVAMSDNTKMDTNYARWEMPVVGHKDIVPRLPTTHEISAIEEDARKNGYDKGYQEGLRAAETDVTAAQNQLKQLLHTMQLPLKAVNENAEQEIMLLVQDICTAILRKEYQADKEKLLGVIREAIQILNPRERCLIYLNPADAKCIRSLLNTPDDLSSVGQLIEDSQLSMGDVRMSCETGQVDAKISNRIQQLIQNFMDEAT